MLRHGEASPRSWRGHRGPEQRERRPSDAGSGFRAPCPPGARRAVLSAPAACCDCRPALGDSRSAAAVGQDADESGRQSHERRDDDRASPGRQPGHADREPAAGEPWRPLPEGAVTRRPRAAVHGTGVTQSQVCHALCGCEAEDPPCPRPGRAQCQHWPARRASFTRGAVPANELHSCHCSLPQQREEVGWYADIIIAKNGDIWTALPRRRRWRTMRRRLPMLCWRHATGAVAPAFSAAGSEQC